MNSQEGPPRCGASRDEGTRERKTEQRERGGWGVDIPAPRAADAASPCLTLVAPLKWAWEPPHLHRWAREMKQPELHPVSGPGKMHAWVLETRQPAGQWGEGRLVPNLGRAWWRVWPGYLGR